MFEDFDNWQVHAVRGGIIQSTVYFPQSYPADAVTVFAACLLRKLGSVAWKEWAFHCIARGGDGTRARTLVYEVGPDGAPVDSKRQPHIDKNVQPFLL